MWVLFHDCRQVLSVYLGRGWRAVEEHLHDVLGRLCRDAGDDSAAVTHFLALLQSAAAAAGGGGGAIGSGGVAGGTRSPAAQTHYLDQLTQCLRSLPPKVRTLR
jgi:hypothetical protein